MLGQRERRKEVTQKSPPKTSFLPLAPRSAPNFFLLGFRSIGRNPFPKFPHRFFYSQLRSLVGSRLPLSFFAPLFLSLVLQCLPRTVVARSNVARKKEASKFSYFVLPASSSSSSLSFPRVFSLHQSYNGCEKERRREAEKDFWRNRSREEQFQVERIAQGTEKGLYLSSLLRGDCKPLSATRDGVVEIGVIIPVRRRLVLFAN